MRTSRRIAVATALLLAWPLLGWAGTIQVDDPVTTTCQKAIRAALVEAVDGSPGISFAPANRYTISRSEQGVRGQATVTSREATLQIAYECTFSSDAGRLTAASFRQTASSAGAVHHDAIQLCQQAIVDKTARSGRAEFPEPAETYSMSGGEQGVRGEAVLLSNGARQDMTYECAVNLRLRRVSSSSFQRVMAIAAQVPPSVQLCQQAIRDRAAAKGDVEFPSTPETTAVSGTVDEVSGTAILEGKGKAMDQEIAYQCTVNVRERRVVAASYEPAAVTASVEQRPSATLCQQAIADRIPKTDRVAFTEPAETEVQLFGTEEVRGRAQLTSSTGTQQIAYECTVNMILSQVLEAEYHPMASTGGPQPSGLSVRYQAHVGGYGWMDWVRDGALAGTTGRGRRIEALRIELDNRGTTDVTYRVHIAGRGWSEWARDGEMAGTTGQERRIEAVQIRLLDPPKAVRLRYRAHVQDVGWMDWVEGGQTAGTTDRSRRLEAIRIELVRE
jgi:hypothetical protein